MQSEDQEYFDYHPALGRRLDRLAATARTAPPHLEARIRGILKQESARRGRRRRISFFAGGATLATATVALALLGTPASDSLAPPLAREAQLGLAKVVAIESADTAALVEWLQSEVGYQVDIPAISNAELVGATVAELGDVRGAAVVYQYRGASLTYFALPAGELLGRPVPTGLTAATANGYEVALWTEQGAARAVAASMPRQAVLQVAEECRGKSR
jgi:anti-sigma factor RsiW